MTAFFFNFRLLALFFILVAIKPAYCAVEFISGFEIGGTNEFAENSGTTSIQTTTFRSGAYALRTNPTTTNVGFVRYAESFTDPSYTRFYFRTDSTPGGDEIFFCAHSTIDCDQSNYGATLQLTSARKIKVLRDAPTPVLQCTGNTVLNIGQWYRIEVFLNRVGTDSYELKINGNVECSGNFDTSLGGALDNWYWGKTFNTNSQSVDFYFDDIQVSADGYPGKGKIIARNAKAGTPTYNGFTKVGCTTIDTCWDETPVNTGSGANDDTTAKQTALIQSFSDSTVLNGKNRIAKNYVINACAVKLWTLATATSNDFIIRIVNGVETSTTVQTSSSSFLIVDDCCWAPGSLSNLNGMEAGMQESGSGIMVAYDLWVECDYVPRRIIFID